ncbi:MAG TPA: hypothetical protein VFQ23_22200 [Anaerolineales bacterium]|nr:hypothetical protein [Anaerolineales bacterium]
MQDWLHFTDSRIALALQYPKVTPQGNLVELDENHEQDTVRVHFRSTGSREVYFEITKYQDLSPQMEYEQHKENLERRPEKFVLTDFREIGWMSQPAYEYSLRWSQGSRVVRLIEFENSTYRVLYDPFSPLNVQILLTLRWTY